MFNNRLRSAVPDKPVVNPSPSPSAFLLCPTPAQTWQQDLYAWALAQAQAVVRPSLLERDLLGVWNRQVLALPARSASKVGPLRVALEGPTLLALRAGKRIAV